MLIILVAVYPLASQIAELSLDNGLLQVLVSLWWDGLFSL